MTFNTITTEELEKRRAEIAVEVDADGADLDALEAEARAIVEELETRRAAEAQKDEIRAAVATDKAGEIVKTFEGFVKMETTITRNSPEYIEAFANYIKTGKDAECRSLLSLNATSGGQLPVPEMVDNIVRHAWETEGIVELCRKTNLKGNVKVGFEKSATGAVIHSEGDSAPDEEELTLGVVTMIPQSIKKWITISDEALDLDAGGFITYVYEELAHQIAKKLADLIVAAVVAAPTTSTTTAAGQAKITASTIAINTIADAVAHLSDEASNPVIVMNKLTYADFKGIQYANKYNVDPFEGLTVKFNNSLPAFSDASSNDCYAIVGDFGKGAQLNFPADAGITFKYDDLSLAEADLVKIVGREYVGIGVVAPATFTRICK